MSKVKKSMKKRVGMSKAQMVGKMCRKNLQSTLKNVYEGSVNLETKMSCECVCCKVAMPQMNYSEFLQIVTNIWGNFSAVEKVNLINKSIEYYFKNDFEKWGIQSLVKPCMLQDDHDLCKVYSDRPLSCRLFGIWPEEEYEKRVEKFAKAYGQYGLEKEDLPLFSQCQLVERVDASKEINMKVIEGLYAALDNIDKKVGDFSDLQVSQKINYRTFHDWIMFKVFGEKWLSDLTSFIMAATKEQLNDQLNILQHEVKKSFFDLDQFVQDQLN